MQKISVADFEKELQAMDRRILIVPNQNRPGAANVFLNGVDICPWVPQFELQDEHSADYTYRLNDHPIPFKTTGEIKEIVQLTLNKLGNKEYSDALFNMPVDVQEETYGEHKV